MCEMCGEMNKETDIMALTKVSLRALSAIYQSLRMSIQSGEEVEDKDAMDEMLLSDLRDAHTIVAVARQAVHLQQSFGEGVELIGVLGIGDNEEKDDTPMSWDDVMKDIDSTTPDEEEDKS